jgi:hypothetical protein
LTRGVLIAIIGTPQQANGNKIMTNPTQDISFPTSLPNGWEIVNIHFNAKTRDGIVMARTEKSRGTEYATWAFYRNDLKSTSGGHYFTHVLKNRRQCLQDYYNRIEILSC